MLRLAALGVLLTFLTLVPPVFAKDIRVRGYYRRDGTYVNPHIRSSPDSFRWNNHGPSRSDFELLNPRARDADSDGLPNSLDMDDNNNGIFDDQDPRQFQQW